MTRWLLFLHITSVALWLGGIVALYVLYQKVVRMSGEAEHALAYETTRSVVRGIINPSAVAVLLTGVVMLVQLGFMGQSKPFWLGFMEQFGGMVALISAGLLTWQIRRIDRASSASERARGWRHLSQTMAFVALGVVATILVVALRIRI